MPWPEALVKASENLAVLILGGGLLWGMYRWLRNP
jgi:hypothetical protein